ncbi:MAG: AAA family ATPase [Pseudomonadota bacterium]
MRDALRQLALAVSALHAGGWVHRDLKPTNILVGPDGRLVVLDFGLVGQRQGGADQSTVAVMGTPLYMAPEQARGERVGFAADWYAVGAMLRHALTGRPPHQGTAAEVLAAKLRDELAPTHALAPGAPRDLADLADRLLARDPAQRPDGAAVMTLLGQPGPRAAHAVQVPVVEGWAIARGPLEEVLRAALERACTGQAEAVLLEGPAGIGKTTLVERFLAQARARGAVVLAGRCFRQERIPYQAFDGVVDALSRWLQRRPAAEVRGLLPRDVHVLREVFPVLDRVGEVREAQGRRRAAADPPERQRRAFEALRELLARLADRWPTVVFIDDLHWGGADGAPLWWTLVRRPDPPPLLLLATFRSDEIAAASLLDQVLAPDAPTPPRRVVVDALSADDCATLAAAWGVADAQSARAIALESAGNPLLVTRLCAAWRRGAQPSLADLTREALDALPAEARGLMEALAVARRPLPVHILAQTAACGAGVGGALDVLSGQQLARLRDQGGASLVEPYHERIRESILDQMGSERRRELHLRLAQALSQEPPEPGWALLIADSYQAAGEPDRALPHLERGARQAEDALALPLAASLYRRMLDLDQARGDEADPAGRGRVQALLGEALRKQGRIEEARQALEGAAALLPARDALPIWLRAANLALVGDRPDGGWRVLREVLAQAGVGIPTGDLRVLLWLGLAMLRKRLRGLSFEPRAEEHVPAPALLRIDAVHEASASLTYALPLMATALHHLHLRLALDAGEPRRILGALAVEAGHVALTHGWAARRRSEALLVIVDRLAHELGDAPARITRLTAVGSVAHYEMRFLDAARAFEEAERIAVEAGLSAQGEAHIARILRVATQHELGRVEDLAATLPALAEGALDRGDVAMWAMASLLSDRHLLARGEPGAVLAIADQVERALPRAMVDVAEVIAANVRVYAHAYLGEGGRAWREHLRIWPTARRVGWMSRFSRVLDRWIHGVAALAWARDEGPAALVGLAFAGRLARQLEREQAPIAAALAAALDAGRCSLLGDLPQASANLRAAAAGFEACGLESHTMAAWRWLGRLLGPEDGQPYRAAADTWATQHGVVDPERFAGSLLPGCWEMPPDGGGG